VPACLGGEMKVEPVKLPARAAHPDRQAFVRRDLLAAGERSVSEAEKAYAAIKADAKATARKRGEAEVAMGLARAKQRALAAVVRAEELEDGGKRGSPEWNAAATEALTTQRNAAVAQAASDLLVGQGAAEDAQAKGAAGAKALKAAQDKVEKARAALASATVE